MATTQNTGPLPVICVRCNTLIAQDESYETFPGSTNRGHRLDRCFQIVFAKLNHLLQSKKVRGKKGK